MLGLRRSIAVIVVAVPVAVLSYTALVAKNHGRHKGAPRFVGMTFTEVIGRSTDFRGRDKADYTLVEFADYQSPACRQAEPEVRNLLRKYPTRLRLAYRNYPLSKHERAEAAAIFAECAREQGKFWPVHDTLIHAEGDTDSPLVHDLPDRIQLRLARFPKDEDAANDRINRDLASADGLRIRSLPAFFLCVRTALPSVFIRCPRSIDS